MDGWRRKGMLGIWWVLAMGRGSISISGWVEERAGRE